MLGGVFLGIKLDNLFGTKPLLTAILSVLGVVLAIYFALRKEFKKPESK
ncbi:MAG: AtpZ/AtpI family protein [Bacteroidales bacterium]|nr:AtpZ/AtpI family protein [Bacteroidales bacterium]MBN2821227.1 AtpZ/AtpI family protein [Bacteroidales bacterium]